MEIGKIKLEEIEVVSIENLKLDAGINQHATLELECLIEQEYMQDYIMLPEKEQQITVREEEKIIFCGTVTQAVCKTKRGNTYLYLTLKNASYLLDRTKIAKSYQNIAMTYQEIAEDKAMTIYAGESETIGNVVVQYQETDWEFLLRMSSCVGTGIYADMCMPKCVIHWGIEDKTVDSNLQITEYTVEKDLELFKKCAENANKKLMEADCITYEFECNEMLKIGDAVSLDGRKVYITWMQCEMNQADFCGLYKAKSKEGICYMPRLRYDMPGTALEGNVIDVDKDKVKVHLTIDEKQDKETAYWFPFSAMEASSDGSGWYYMPEPGDCVKVCIPSWDEKDAFAVSAVSSYDGKADTEDKMADTNSMYMRNPSGKQMQMTQQHIKADGGNGQSMFEMDAEGNMTLCANQSVSIEAMETIEIEAGDVIEIKAAKVLNVKTAMTGEILMNEAGELQHLGGHVNINREE